MWILSLPLFEIAVCFHQGWGIPKSIPAAIHFYKTAAGLGDPDAMYELGFLLLRGYHAKSWYERHHPEGIKEKMEAASWLRSAHGKGHTVVGESWIFQAKWGGTG
ncbi:hypothetical protein BC830DRAFT_1071157 [Chytriomyces sp. MP71]|nr:hypothetical protein BC830DRAFT_1071157 [Chytriomyces sp. MP71]